MSNLFYLQDKRSVVGNSMSWWAIEGRGYTCDIRCAQVWTKEELEKDGYWTMDGYKHAKYQVWPKDVIDRLVQWHVDVQDVTYKNNDDSFANAPHTLKSWRPDLCR